jgi:hypothetical protein
VQNEKDLHMSQPGSEGDPFLSAWQEDFLTIPIGLQYSVLELPGIVWGYGNHPLSTV